MVVNLLDYELKIHIYIYIYTHSFVFLLVDSEFPYQNQHNLTTKWRPSLMSDVSCSIKLEILVDTCRHMLQMLQVVSCKL